MNNRNNSTMIVITGVDGTGKTTHSTRLQKFLQGQKKEATRFHQFSSGPIMRFLLSIGKEHLESLEQGTASGKNTRIGPLGKTLQAIAIVRILLTGITHTWTRLISGRKSQYVIFDRYFYDVLIKISWMYQIDHRKLRYLEKMVPCPDIIFILKAESEIALSRENDGDLTMAELDNKQKIYNEYFEEQDDVHWIDTTNKNIDEIQEELQKIVIDRC